LKLVLDTNVVIDWLVFDDVFLADFRRQVLGGQVVVVTHEPARAELRRVLGYKELKLDAERQASVLKRYETQTTKWNRDGAAPATGTGTGTSQAIAGAAVASAEATPAEPPLPKNFPRCRDPDDNPFLELAWRSGADALVSRDDAVLKLAKRARKHGFEIFTVPQLVDAISRP
jgi:uncharacterized protein